MDYVAAILVWLAVTAMACYVCILHERKRKSTAAVALQDLIDSHNGRIEAACANRSSMSVVCKSINGQGLKCGVCPRAWRIGEEEA